MRRKLSIRHCITALLLLCGTLAAAEDLADAAVKRLSSVGLYALGGVGFAGKITQGTLDYRMLLAQPKPVAEAAFEKLYTNGNPQARAYALTGMKKVNPARFKEMLVSAEDSTAMVNTARGCILSREPLMAIAKGLDREAARP